MIALLVGTALFAALAAGTFAPLEAWFPRSEPTRSGVPWRAAALCVGLLLVDTAVMRLVGTPLLDTVAAATDGGAFADGLAPWARIVGALILGDVLGYWLHRAMHHVPWLWRLHRVHHAPVDLHFWEAWRLHPIDFLCHSLAVGIPGAVLGAPFASVVWLVLLRKAFTAYLHSNLPWRHRGAAWLLASPSWHAVHHDADRQGQHANFAALFPLVDRLFGSHRDPPRSTAVGDQRPNDGGRSASALPQL